jgi:hypothetical protein
MRLRRGGVGLAVSLFAPPLLASVAVGLSRAVSSASSPAHRIEQDIPGHSDS